MKNKFNPDAYLNKVIEERDKSLGIDGDFKIIIGYYNEKEQFENILEIENLSAKRSKDIFDIIDESSHADNPFTVVRLTDKNANTIDEGSIDLRRNQPSFLVQVNQDDYNIIQVAKEVLKLDEPAAVSALIEIGLLNLIMPDKPKDKLNVINTIDQNLSKPEFQELSKRLKAVWNV